MSYTYDYGCARHLAPNADTTESSEAKEEEEKGSSYTRGNIANEGDGTDGKEQAKASLRSIPMIKYKNKLKNLVTDQVKMSPMMKSGMRTRMKYKSWLLHPKSKLKVLIRNPLSTFYIGQDYSGVCFKPL